MLQKCLNDSKVNCEPLSVTKVSRTSKQLNNSDYLLIVSLAVRLAIAKICGHFVSASTMTKNVVPGTKPAKSACSLSHGLLGFVQCCGLHFSRLLVACNT